MSRAPNGGFPRVRIRDTVGYQRAGKGERAELMRAFKKAQALRKAAKQRPLRDIYIVSVPRGAGMNMGRRELRSLISANLNGLINGRVKVWSEPRRVTGSLLYTYGLRPRTLSKENE